MKWNQRITQAREAKALGKSDLAKLIGVKPPTITQWESGETKKIEGRNLINVCAALGITPEWLLTGKNRTEATEGSNIEPAQDFKTNREYPVISWVQAGEWTELCDNFHPGDAEERRPCHIDLGRCGYILRVKGPSMTAPPGEKYTFPDGFLLYVNPDIDVLPGKFVIVRRNSTLEATFKRYILMDDEPYLEALNPAWPNRYIKLVEGDQFCGVVVHAGYGSMP